MKARSEKWKRQSKEMKRKNHKTIIPLGPEFCQVYKRKAGAHPHRLTRRKKTRQKEMVIRDTLREY